MNKPREDQFILQEGKCWFCACEMSLARYFEDRYGKSYATWDHLLPKSRGGSNDPKNLVLACSKCNIAKGSMTTEEFILSKVQGLPSLTTQRKMAKKVIRANKWIVKSRATKRWEKKKRRR